MRLIQYIPTQSVLQELGLSSTSVYSMARENGYMVVSPSILGQSVADMFEFQYMPDVFGFSGSANYIEHGGKGVSPRMEFIHANLEQLDLSFLLIDDVRVGERPLPFEGDTLYPAIRFFRELDKPTMQTNHPPTVGLYWGELHFEGVVTSYAIKILKSYEDLTPKIVSVRLNLKGEFH